jgi:hypothetical protein
MIMDEHHEIIHDPPVKEKKDSDKEDLEEEEEAIHSFGNGTAGSLRNH